MLSGSQSLYSNITLPCILAWASLKSLGIGHTSCWN